MSVVAVAQLVESRIVIPVVVGSSPISHPKEFRRFKVSHSKAVPEYSERLFVFGNLLRRFRGFCVSGFARLVKWPTLTCRRIHRFASYVKSGWHAPTLTDHGYMPIRH